MDMDKSTRIFVAGHNGMVGSALVRSLALAGYRHIITRSRAELNLTDQAEVNRFFSEEIVDVVLLAAARVGGIYANSSKPAQFIYDNLAIQTNVIHAAYESFVARLVFFGSSSSYPKLCEQPIKEDYLLTGALEESNEPNAIAKIAGLKMCEAYNRQYGTQFITVMPTNLYGRNDNYDLNDSHALPALIRKTHEAKIAGAESVNVWGTGLPRREFLHVDDLAAAAFFLLQSDVPGGVFNVGVGDDISILELAQLIREIVGFRGDIVFDQSKPDGTPRKLLDVSRLTRMGWKPSIALKAGVEATYQDFLGHLHARGGVVDI